VATRAWDVDGNVAALLAGLETAAAQGAELAITPECVFHGYGFGDAQADSLARLRAVAEPVDGPNVSRVRALARAARMAVVLGFAERGDDDAVHNAAAVIGPDGAVLDVYRKVHCRTSEDINFTGPFTPGDRFVCSELGQGDGAYRLGTLICFDREIPESVRCLRAMGAHLIACPLACDTDKLADTLDFAHNEMITRCRAAENEVFFAVINHAGRFNGGSFVVGPGGETIVQLDEDAEVRTVELPVRAVRDILHPRAHSWMGWGFRRQPVYDRHLRSDPAG
jgi:predicted amidohydrolase